MFLHPTDGNSYVINVRTVQGMGNWFELYTTSFADIWIELLVFISPIEDSIWSISISRM
jgi:hypothetical protein